MPRRVLIVDDDADIREVARLSLELTAGWEVLAAGSGPEGVAMAVAEQPDAVLLDVMMPDMDGPETLALLRRTPGAAHLPVVLLTARAQEEDRRLLEALDVTGLLLKPFDPMSLAGQVADLLGWPSPG